jgi:A/G-specific adenine glycosylase
MKQGTRRKAEGETLRGGEGEKTRIGETSNSVLEVLTQKSLFTRRLLAWFQKNARDLPWRRTRDPYRIWVSEIMLQQTQVSTVVPYYERFLARFPAVAALAAADEQEVLRLWEGLGYYRRARQMHRAARVIALEHHGVFPRDASVVRSLPGIGRYTAGAILSIAHNARLPILEANTVRLFCRLSAYRDDPLRSAGQKHLWALAEKLLPKKGSGTFNQALMELGSQICTPAAPRCGVCPVRALCPTHRLGAHESIPLPPQKTAYEEVHEAAMIVWRGGRVLMRRCASGERWAGLWDFPRFAVSKKRGPALHHELMEKVRNLTGVRIQGSERFTTLKHGVTRFRITLDCHEAEFVSSVKRSRSPDLQWVRPTELGELPLSVTGRKLSRLLETFTASALRAKK